MPPGTEDVDEREELSVSGVVPCFLGGQLAGAESHGVPTAVNELRKHGTNGAGGCVSLNANGKGGVEVDQNGGLLKTLPEL